MRFLGDKQYDTYRLSAFGNLIKPLKLTYPLINRFQQAAFHWDRVPQRLAETNRLGTWCQEYLYRLYEEMNMVRK